MNRASDIIALIPDVKPRLAMRVLKEAIFAGKHGYESLDPADRKLALRDGWVLTISPIGGRILLELFEAGLIPQKIKHASKDVSHLRSYAANEDAYREQVREEEERKAAYERRVAEIAEDPDCADPSEITSDLIDRVFLKRFGYGHFGEMRIAGLSCHKDKLPDQKSNSGQRTYSGEVYCYWYDAEGEQHGYVPDLTPKNRRNDPKRNWGLGRD
ncbi:hypothetical protein M8756_01895 [Lutimaribacter sp. EGI FJ00015]|uniref:Uncharacterized protein n=1 Tax=Lutimaribacter degradans TaxID=2945989 RepID=A0ACC5ZRQ2_9RHOB|nr:hypothetical protein [Lutimaribacter sp. EGI FJ00013]MCM2561007.1 hypothetical protein [Lutimaribacter sp. EGI FJ00013]MCO0612046.1 hypothetical protein [Lutimaribacter sp. EGI FJ00015]MCO0634834.1 hypothetical protein [Lutimaribacter sp. EGI FJ00014]